MKSQIKLIKSTLKIIYRNATRSIVQVPFAIGLCVRFFRNKRTHYIVICDHIGDFLITMGFLNAYRSTNHLNHVTVCITPKFVELLPLYRNTYDDFQCYSPKTIYKILALGATNFGIHALKKLKNITLINPADAFTEESFEYVMRYPQLSLKDCIQYGCLNLKTTNCFYLPKIHKESCIKKPRNFTLGKTVLLSPFSRAAELIADDLFICLAQHLKETGFTVLTNLSEPDHIPIPGTQGVYYSLTEITSLVECGGYVVGARSGLLDLLAYTDCRMVAIYPADDSYMNFFDLSMLPDVKATILQIKMSLTVEKIAQTIITFLKGEKICQ